MKAIIFFVIGAALIFAGYKILPQGISVNGLDTNSTANFSVFGVSKKTIAISLFVIGGIIFIWGFFKIEWKRQ